MVTYGDLERHKVKKMLLATNYLRYLNEMERYNASSV